MLIAAVKSREIMWGLSTGLEILWYTLVGISILVFAYGVARPIVKYRRGNRQGLPRVRELPRRVWEGTRTLYAHSTVARRDPAVGWAHRGIFFGWCVLALGTVIVALDHDLTGPLFSFYFFTGDFYLGAKAALNAFGTALILGTLFMMFRRAVIRPARLDYARPDRAAGEPQFDRRIYRVGDWVFIGLLLVIAVTGYLLEGIRMAMDHPGFNGVQFGGWIAAQGFEAFTATNATLAAIRHGIWWFHGLLAIAVVAAIPYTKAAHMLTSYASLILRDPDAMRRLRPIPEELDSAPAGYATLADFSSLHLLQIDACTKCGKCHVACPATATGQPLSPRDVILELHERSAHEFEMSGPGGVLGPLLNGHSSKGGNVTVIGEEAVRDETLWACMQCNACVDICPVGIEQAPIINQLRRRLVEEGSMDPGLESTLRVIHKSGNSFGERARRRGRWTEELEFEVKDAREEPVDILWFVGDYASFDPRSQQVSRALARLLSAGGVDFGILYDGERNSGNDVRRVGEEGLFESLAQHNLGVLSDCEFQRIVTTDPHSLNTLRNEYPDLGGRWDVLHHTALLLELLETGKLTPVRQLDYRVTYHDPCHLGRMNGGYDAPRKLIDLVGCELAEMPRNRDQTFCCGAGGGRIWIADGAGGERPSENRIREAVSLGELDYFVVSCPKDVTMYEDAIKTSGNASRLDLREVTELVEEGCGVKSAGSASDRAVAGGG